jgi:hypothetical protein
MTLILNKQQMKEPKPISIRQTELNLLKYLLDRYWEVLVSSHNSSNENTKVLLISGRSKVINKIEKANQVVLKIERFLKLITLKKNIEISENDNDNVDFVNECLKENDWNNEKLVTDAVRKVKKTIN